MEPRGRNGEFDPQLVKKGQRRLPGFDDKAIALYAHGLRTREIRGPEKGGLGLSRVGASAILLIAIVVLIMLTRQKAVEADHG